MLFFSLSLCFCLSRFGEEERFVFASMCQAAFLWTLGDSPVDLTSQRHTFPSGCSTLSPSLFCSFFHSFFLSFFLSFILSFFHSLFLVCVQLDDLMETPNSFPPPCLAPSLAFPVQAFTGGLSISPASTGRSRRVDPCCWL